MQEPIGSFIHASLPRTLWIAEADFDVWTILINL